MGYMCLNFNAILELIFVGSIVSELPINRSNSDLVEI